METPSVSRRDALKLSALGAAALVLPFQPVVFGAGVSTIDKKLLPRPYTVPFAVPPTLTPLHADATTDYYRVVQAPFQAQVLPGVTTTLWGYNGSAPGPTIKVHKGRRTVVRQVNALPQVHPVLGYAPSTSTHLHGSPSEPQYDGYASDLSWPGMWKDYVYPNDCEARTLWYHDHGLHHTAQNVFMGLAAQYQVLDDVERALPLPKGRYDVPLIITDAAFAADGSLLFDDDGHNSAFGDVVLVNGRPWPAMPVEQRKYRFRILNASVSRGYLLAFSDGRPFSVIATDGGLVPKPISVAQLRMGMGERYEIVVDFAGLPVGATLELTNLGVKNTKDYDDTDKVMQFRVTGPATDLSGNQLPSTLAPPHPAMQLTASMAKRTRRMRLKKDDVTGIWSIDDVTWDDVVDSGYTKVFSNPKPGDVEIWEIDSRSGGWFHPLHVHFVDFQVLGRNGRPPRPEERGPKDTVYAAEGDRKLRLLMRFSTPDGPHGRYMIHCHNLTHEDHDMMTQYQIGEHDADCDPINTAPPRSGAETPLWS